MKKYSILCLFLLLALLLFGCAAQGDAVGYETEHEHVYGFWYDATDEQGQKAQMRYCKICHATETQPANTAD